MPNLTPIPLTEEQRERLTSVKHKLEASSWREMLMKLCDIYEDLCKTDQPTTLLTEQDVKAIVEKTIEEKLKTTKPEEKSANSLYQLLNPTNKPEEKKENIKITGL